MKEILLQRIRKSQKKQWQTLITVNRFSLNPFVQFACSLVTCPPQIITQAITLNRGNINLAGKLDNFAIE
jgi:translocation and assembly module TamB